MGGNCSTVPGGDTCCVSDLKPDCSEWGANGHKPIGVSSVDKPGDEDSLRACVVQTLAYNDGSTYVGQVDAEGRRHGIGRWTSDVGCYDGQWRDDVQHGEGHQEWSDGRSYDGQFANGKFNGYGKMVWQAQLGVLSYEGQYQNDLKHGIGKFCWADGRTYEGEWQNGKRHGKGLYTSSSGDKKVCHWADDKFKYWDKDKDGKEQEKDGNPPQ
mmetsp:Transcript_50787/g.120686  ORF Transcript_50787/g.120686 Transcript_50787/m.120686 type:complete len:212 (+) Transcript_50787:103-738(+)|eukprot:CAMPEP_0178424926 /NCGR_PEP_ID=MMETSP0689_2-20121128/28461_1 /TAXON_ID=160604 /ORGANISM="Amphidinium massartii, Strain CS-259" /LENGTH=211 /DNA_ID=CAMNT_0020046577 /DNA_START=26 /DNA_END=661 /DNA_ORIENTATION=-